MAYTPHRDLNPAHDSPDAPSSSSPQVSQVILDPVVDPQQVVSGWDEPVSSQRLQEEYQRGYEAGLKAALEQQETQPKEKVSQPFPRCPLALSYVALHGCNALSLGACARS